MRGAVAAAVLAVSCAGVASSSMAAPYAGLTQDLLWRPGLSPFRFLFRVCVLLAMGLTLGLLAGLKRSLDAGRPVRVLGVVMLGTASACSWTLVWALGDAPAFAPLVAPVWLAD